MIMSSAATPTAKTWIPFSEDKMWEQQAKSINTSAPLQSRNEHIMQRLHDLVIAIQTTEITGGEVKEEWVCEMSDLVSLYHELNFDKFIQKYENQGKN